MPKQQISEESDYESSQEQQKQQKAVARKPQVQRLDKFKNLKSIVMNVSMTQYSVVSEVAEDLDWKLQYSYQQGDWDVFWCDTAINPDVLIKMHLFQKISHFPGIHIIARKNLLGLNLMALREKMPDQYNFFPLTWMLPMQYAQFRAYFETKPKGKTRTYIAKPQADCQGRGIFLTRRLQDLQNGKHYVIQRYLARPFLIDGLKFDLRIYVLLCGTNPLRLYLYDQGLARFATQPYHQPTRKNLQKQYVHLTNYAINKRNPKFIFNTNSKNMGIGHKRSLSCVFGQLEALGVDIPVLKKKIKDVIIKTIICGLPLISLQYRCSQPQDYTGNMCFHILGMDIMLDNRAQPIVLQVNHTPSFTTDTPLDHKIKYNLIKDTLVLMNVNVKQKNELYNKAKDINKQRLLTGKRQIFEGKQKQKAIFQAQKLRDQYQSKHLGGYQKIYPVQDENQARRYQQIIDISFQTYAQQNGSNRMKMIEKQGKRLIRADRKQAKEKEEVQNQKQQQLQKVVEVVKQQDIEQKMIQSMPRPHPKTTQTAYKLEATSQNEEIKVQTSAKSHRAVSVSQPVSCPRISKKTKQARKSAQNQPINKGYSNDQDITIFQIEKKIKTMGKKCMNISKIGPRKQVVTPVQQTKNPQTVKEEKKNNPETLREQKAVPIKFNRKFFLNPKSDRTLLDSVVNAQLLNMSKRQQRGMSRLMQPRQPQLRSQPNNATKEIRSMLQRKSVHCIMPKLVNLNLKQKKIQHGGVFMCYHKQQSSDY